MAFSHGPLILTGDQGTADFAVGLSRITKPGDCFLLWGDIGAGKSTLARAFIRALTHPNEEVPSPTFTLVQTYQSARGEIWHADLYRLTNPDELIELGLDDAFDSAITLVEWPDRLGEDTPPHALNLRLTANDTAHSLRIDGDDIWADRLAGLLIHD